LLGGSIQTPRARAWISSTTSGLSDSALPSRSAFRSLKAPGHLSLTKDRPPRTSSKTFVCLPCACATRSSTSKHSLEAAAAKAFFVPSPCPALISASPLLDSALVLIPSTSPCKPPSPPSKQLSQNVHFLSSLRLPSTKATFVVHLLRIPNTGATRRRLDLNSANLIITAEPAFVVASNNIVKPSRTPTSHLLGCSFPQPPQPASVPNAPSDPAE
ncbi:hypothetical protein KCU93_g60, partial [Aureobasidium melanogenum]